MTSKTATEIAAAAEIMRPARNMVVFTGAGISTESGIPDFRSPGGLWSKYDPEEFTFQRFKASATARAKYWRMSDETYRIIQKARPNAAHLAITALDKAGRLTCLITQNIDGLHQLAGVPAEKVIELHGTALHIACLDCGRKYDRESIAQRIAGGDTSPRCDECDGLLKPATISFGQSMPVDEMEHAYRHAQTCDVFIVIGSSLVVQPAASLPLIAKKNAAHLIIINRDPTGLDHFADVVIHTSAGQVVSQIVDMIDI